MNLREELYGTVCYVVGLISGVLILMLVVSLSGKADRKVGPITASVSESIRGTVTAVIDMPGPLDLMQCCSPREYPDNVRLFCDVPPPGTETLIIRTIRR